MDPALTQALKTGVAPMQEYLLQGSILDGSKDILLHRLRGLCDNADTAPETFSDHEMVFQMKGPQQQMLPINVQVRHSLVHPECWHLRYVGQTEMGIGDKSRHTLVRTCLDIGVSDTVVKFLNEMGFRADFEFVARGIFFHKGRMKVTVSKLFKLSQPGDPQAGLEPVSGSHLVELSVVAPTGQEQVGEDMKNFAEQLKPLVCLEKIDHKPFAAAKQGT
ncbi:mediator of RNA polymerase II transcription subunit 18-like [Mya arenaria]|uniref:mediator of RNA polymerase II transcription subunit 18-like n=1 Tax=Mya arenaria TaxID=6604 RepID=UPI0022E7DCF4|nr:mediator of RNA polymerase II transcription subunit 18-like [Mya arenaria]XP_052798346.1 mediator of RNA polymerase II transcription subunit 18-like [Mya arenaria]